MIADAIELLIDQKGFKIFVEPLGWEEFLVSSKELIPLIGFFLKRQREA